MLLVLANRYDAVARQFVTRWKDHDVHLLTGEDMSVRGWRYYLSDARPSTIMVGGQEVAQESIDGVLIRLPSIYAGELTHIVPEDRTYVSIEMTAFLTAWLSSLSCPVLNRPTPISLSGPGWRREQWTYMAAQLGMRVHPIQRQAQQAGNAADGYPLQHPDAVSVTIVGKHIIGSTDAVYCTQAAQLADAAGVELLTVEFGGTGSDAHFLQAHVWSDLTQPDIAHAVIDYFQGKREAV